MKKKLDLNEAVFQALIERFGEPIGDAPSTVGVADEKEELLFDDAEHDDGCTCEECGKITTMEGVCEAICEAKKKKKKKKKVAAATSAKEFVKGTKTFADKVAKAKKAGMDSPEGFAAWAEKTATGKWPAQLRKHAKGNLN